MKMESIRLINDGHFMPTWRAMTQLSVLPSYLYHLSHERLLHTFGKAIYKLDLGLFKI